MLYEERSYKNSCQEPYPVSCKTPVPTGPHQTGASERRQASDQQWVEKDRQQHLQPLAYRSGGEIIYGCTPKQKRDVTQVLSSDALPALIRGGEEKESDLTFIWEKRFSNQFGLIAGRQGLGKSMFAGFLAACITNPYVEKWPDDSPCPTGTVIFFTPEGGTGSTDKRIQNMGGEINNVVYYKGMTNGRIRPDGTLDPDFEPLLQDIDALNAAISGAEEITHQPVRLIIIDPLTDFLGTIQQNDNAEVTKALRGLDYLAIERNLCILGVKHLNKGSNNTSALYNVGGANAFTSKPRFVYILDEHPESREANLNGDIQATTQRVVLAPAKSNDFRIPASIEYQLVGEDDIQVKICNCNGTYTADSLLARLAGVNSDAGKSRRGRTENTDLNDEIRALFAMGKNVKEIMELTGSSQAHIYKIWKALKEAHENGETYGSDD